MTVSGGNLDIPVILTPLRQSKVPGGSNTQVNVAKPSAFAFDLFT